jgi:ribosomal protein L40E
LGDGKSVKISAIRSVSSQSNKLGSLDIYFGGNLFVTLSTIDKEDHDFVIGILKAAYAASKSIDNSAPAKVKKPSKPVAAEPKPKNSNLGKETVTCSECSANLPAGAKFCLDCGVKVLPKGVCLECNAKLPEKAKFCSECGTPAGTVPAKPAQPKVDAQALIASIGSTDVPVDGGGEGAIDSSEGMVSGEIVDWRQAADRAFNFFFNAIRKGEDTDTAAEWFRGEIADQTEAAGIVYDYGWEEEITPSQLQIISNIVANRLKGLNDEQGYQVSSDFYHGCIASFSNIIYNRSQEGNGDFEKLQEYWDQTICNELPEECGTRIPNPHDN